MDDDQLNKQIKNRLIQSIQCFDSKYKNVFTCEHVFNSKTMVYTWTVYYICEKCGVIFKHLHNEF